VDYSKTNAHSRNKSFETLLIYLKGPEFLIYVSGALSMWGDRMWHFAMSVFLIELYGHNLLLTGIFGLVVAGSVLLLGALIGDWVDRNPRNKVAHASLFIQNISVTVCSIVLMLVFSYKKRIEQIWDGWLTVVCYMVVIVLANVANLASTALTIAIQRDWIVVITGYNRGHLAGMNATMRRIDQVTNILAPLAVGQVMTLSSNVVGCGFILGWNLVSLIVEFIFLSRVYRIVPALSIKPPAMEHQSYLEKKRERKRSQGKTYIFEITRCMMFRPMTSACPAAAISEENTSMHLQEIILAKQSHLWKCIYLKIRTFFLTILRNVMRVVRYSQDTLRNNSYANLFVIVRYKQTMLRRKFQIVKYKLFILSLYLAILTFFFPYEKGNVIIESLLKCCYFPGLWSFDLTVTQLLQETICESERGVVNGVQSSMNYLMDLLHFIMVISAPQPQHFGILVIISILFIFTGHTMYFLYARKVKKKPRTNT
uniref:Solute carrier family 40 member n=1 Tax=Sinocyclocheilus grahami TaxID=75366 RepID=A0A672KLJ7_SINGR